MSAKCLYRSNREPREVSVADKPTGGRGINSGFQVSKIPERKLKGPYDLLSWLLWHLNRSSVSFHLFVCLARQTIYAFLAIFRYQALALSWGTHALSY